SEDPAADERRLREAVKVLLEYPGQDQVVVEVQSGPRRVRLALGAIATGYSPDLHRLLEEMLGADGVVVEAGE
ncbi:MAG: hypothetical protein HY686_02155, partial [Chloroflexi bacterium]|nr:hypothetical protein [Chloroflexota bacterium]